MIRVGDCLEVMRTLDANSIDAVVTDPPYHLLANKRDDPRRASPDSAQRARKPGAGFMGMAWDGGDVAMRPDTWAEVLRVAKPGAYLAAFGGTRTFHRMMCAIEDAGWELRDTLMWVYGSGFPKSKNLDGDRAGWGTALKPAWEPIVLARKPLVGTVAANVLAYGTGALNIDGCRIAAEDERAPITGKGALPCRHDVDAARMPAEPAQPHPEGRWPANLVHDGSDAVMAAFPETLGQKSDASSDSEARKTQNVYGAMRRGRGDEAGADSDNNGAVGFKLKPGARRLDEGSAARFFYCAKADREDRNDGCEGMAKRPLLWSSGDANPGSFQAEGTERAAQNNHPTVKPTDLMRWLCRLVTPPGGLVLDPFTGSGSTGRGAVAEGFRFVGIELDPAYATIAEARIRAMQPGLAF